MGTGTTRMWITRRKKINKNKEKKNSQSDLLLHYSILLLLVLFLPADGHPILLFLQCKMANLFTENTSKLNNKPIIYRKYQVGWESIQKPKNPCMSFDVKRWHHPLSQQVGCVTQKIIIQLPYCIDIHYFFSFSARSQSENWTAEQQFKNPINDTDLPAIFHLQEIYCFNINNTKHKSNKRITF